MRFVCTLAAALAIHGAAIAAPTRILFVGNSYTFGRVDPVLSYNTRSVEDMTRPRPDDPEPNFTDTVGTRAWEPHPWGGVSGIFKQLADEAGLEFEVLLSTRNAASLRGHYLNTANSGNTDWDLRGNIAKKKWDIVVLQEQSDAALPPGRGANADQPAFSAYVDKIEKYIHIGAAENYTERAMYTEIYGSVANCRAAGGSSCNSGAERNIPRNPNANAAAKVYLLQTWARPDMVFAHLNTVADANYPTVPDGRPIVDTSNPDFPNGYPDTLYYETEGLTGMTTDLRAAFAAKVESNPDIAGVIANPNIAGVIPVGDAFQRAVDEGIAKGDGFYNAEGTYADEMPQDKINLWWIDYLHASEHGSYLSALVIFGKLTGINPASFGANEKAAADLGISPGDAVKLQGVAWDQLAAEGMPLRMIPCLRANPNAPGADAASPSRAVCDRGRGK